MIVSGGNSIFTQHQHGAVEEKVVTAEEIWLTIS